MLIFFSPLRLLWQKHMGQHIITVDKRNTIFCNKGPGVSVFFNPCTGEYIYVGKQPDDYFICHCSHALKAKLILFEFKFWKKILKFFN